MVSFGRLHTTARTSTAVVAVVAHFLLVGAPNAQVHGSRSSNGGLTLTEVVRSALENNVAVKQGRYAKRIRDAELRIARGAFDTDVAVTTSAGRASALFPQADREFYGVAASQSGVTSYRVAAIRRFESGLTISPGVELVRQDALTLRAPPLIRTQAALTVSYPVLRAGMRSFEAADLDAAELLKEASEFDLQHAGALSVYRAVDAYWTYRSAYESLTILSLSEDKADRLLRETRMLVERGERPASELDPVQADLADRFAARMNGEHRLAESRRQLGLEMGLTVRESSALPEPSTPFPRVQRILPEALQDRLIATAYVRRADLKSAARHVKAAGAARDARRLETRPALSVRVDAGYAALSERRLKLGHHLPFGYHDVGGPNTSVSLVLDWPTENNRALGALARQEAVLQQNSIAATELRRRLAAAIQNALEELRTTAAELVEVEKAVGLYAIAVENEKKRLQLGMSTQFDLILVEERLRNTLLSRLAVETRHAQSIARLRYETGTLLSESSTPTNEVSVDSLLTPLAPTE